MNSTSMHQRGNRRAQQCKADSVTSWLEVHGCPVGTVHVKRHGSMVV